MDTSHKPGYLTSLLQLKCPRCRRASLFKVSNPYRLKHLFDMHENCPVCGQKTELEIGFWYGTGYVSYALAVALSAINLLWYWLIFGITWRDNSIYWWLIINSAILLVTMPWLLRLSRIIYLNIFVHYDPEIVAELGNTTSEKISRKQIISLRNMLEGIHHIAVICSNYDRSKKFYTEILGLEIKNEVWRKERNSWKLDLTLNGKYIIELFSFPDPPERPSFPEAAGLRHIAFAVKNINQAVEEFTKKNIKCEPIRKDEFTGKKFTFFADPDGLPIELYEM